MSEYKTVMLAVDLTEESLQVAKRATQLVQAYAAELHVVHVIEPLSLAYGGDVPMDLSTVQEQIQEQATSHLREFSATLTFPSLANTLYSADPKAKYNEPQTNMARTLSWLAVMADTAWRYCSVQRRTAYCTVPAVMF